MGRPHRTAGLHVGPQEVSSPPAREKRESRPVRPVDADPGPPAHTARCVAPTAASRRAPVLGRPRRSSGEGMCVSRRSTCLPDRGRQGPSLVFFLNGSASAHWMKEGDGEASRAVAAQGGSLCGSEHLAWTSGPVLWALPRPQERRPAKDVASARQSGCHRNRAEGPGRLPDSGAGPASRFPGVHAVREPHSRAAGRPSSAHMCFPGGQTLRRKPARRSSWSVPAANPRADGKKNHSQQTKRRKRKINRPMGGWGRGKQKQNPN